MKTFLYYIPALILLLSIKPVLPENTYSCTRIFGFSQTKNWGKYFDDYIGDESKYGATAGEGWGIDEISQPNHEVWQRTPSCGNADRVLVQVSSNKCKNTEEDVEGCWAVYVDKMVTTIHAKLPGVKEILFVPVVGCSEPCEEVRAARNFPYILQGLDIVAAKYMDVDVLGRGVRLCKCADYRDGKGHLSDGAPEAACKMAKLLHQHDREPSVDCSKWCDNLTGAPTSLKQPQVIRNNSNTWTINSSTIKVVDLKGRQLNRMQIQSVLNNSTALSKSSGQVFVVYRTTASGTVDKQRLISRF